MARPPRYQYAAAVYHVMARGDGGKRNFSGREDRESFLALAGAGLREPSCSHKPACKTMQKEAAGLKILKKYGKTFKSKD